MVHFAAVRSVEQTSNDSAKTVYTIKAGMKSLNYGYSISGNITVYLYINGTQVKSWTGGFSSAYGETKTKYFGTYTYTVNKTHASQSVSVYTKVKNSSGFDNGTDSSTTWSGTVAAKPSYGVSYNANGGSGAPAGQTKWYGESLALQSKGSLARTGYTPQGWATSSGGAVSYGFGTSYTGNAALTLYAVWKANSYTVSYDTDGGSAVASTSRMFAQDYAITSAEPTKENHNFLGWATSSGGAVDYSAGQVIGYRKGEATNITLYAVWELAYKRPTATLKVTRSDDDETRATAVATWEMHESGATFQRAVLEWKPVSSTEYSTISEFSTAGATGATFDITGASGTTSYDVRLTVYDENASGTASDILTTSYYTMDFLAGGRGVAIGAPATEEGFKCAMDAEFAGKVNIAKSDDVMWYQGRDGSPLNFAKPEKDDAYYPAITIPTRTGAWSIGTYDAHDSIWNDDTLSMAFVSDDAYSRADNSVPGKAFVNKYGVFNGNWMTVKPSKAVTLPTAVSRFVMDSLWAKTGGGLEHYNGGIRCQHSGNILVFAQIYLTTGFSAGDYVSLCVYRNDTEMSYSYTRMPSPTPSYMTLTIAPVFLTVSAGDWITIRTNNAVAARGSFNLANTSMTVTYIS